MGKTVASANMLEGVFESELVLENVQKLGSSEFSKVLHASGDEIEMSTILGSEPIKDIWLVTFSGSFSPKRIPSGINAPIYSKIDVFLDGRDGSVIGVHMHN